MKTLILPDQEGHRVDCAPMTRASRVGVGGFSRHAKPASEGPSQDITSAGRVSDSRPPLDWRPLSSLRVAVSSRGAVQTGEREHGHLRQGEGLGMRRQSSGDDVACVQGYPW
jgi:hypothetical protein